MHLILVEDMDSKEVFAVGQVPNRPFEWIMYRLKDEPGWFTCGEWHSFPEVGRIASLKAWRANPGAFGPTCAIALIVANGEDYTVGGNCLAIRNHAHDRGVEPEWLQSFVDRNKARACADVEV